MLSRAHTFRSIYFSCHVFNEKGTPGCSENSLENENMTLLIIDVDDLNFDRIKFLQFIELCCRYIPKLNKYFFKQICAKCCPPHYLFVSPK